MAKQFRKSRLSWDKEQSAAHSIVARRAQFSNKGRIHLRGPTCQLHFSLAEERRTIHLLRRVQE
jgi:hypothetical protein